MFEWKKTVTVGSGGHIEIALPQLREGEHVEVIVRGNGHPLVGSKRPGYGSARGLIKVSDDFDATPNDFLDYT